MTNRIQPSTARRRRALLAVKVLVSAAALAFTFSRISLTDLKGAMLRLDTSTVTVAVVLTLTNIVFSAVRWRTLLAAYGAQAPPKIAFLARAQLVGHFYNTLVPGNITGDFLRGHATRAAFESPAGSYMIVGIDRFFGLAGLFALSASSLMISPLPGVVRVDLLAALAFATALSISLVPLLGRKIGRYLPGRVGKTVQHLPVPSRPGLLGVVLAMSIVTHAIVALTGHVLFRAIAPQIAARESFVLIPLAMVATYVPFTVAGLGARETAFAFLFSQVGIPGADATAVSLALFGVYSIVALLGGVVHLARPLRS